ncbi:HD domain-containing protein [Paenibacillus marinisediminis]
MNIQLIQEVAFKTMSKRKSHLQRERGFIYYHGERVAKIALRLRNAIFPEQDSMDDIIYMGALFHDVTKGIEPHNQTGAYLIPSLLKEYCTGQELTQVSEIIEFHNCRQQENQPFYVKIVQDADVIDHFGSLQMWLKFMYSAHTEENVFDAIRLWESAEHAQYIKNNRNVLNYDLSKEIYDKKIEFERAYQERFTLECNGEIEW